MGILKLEQGTMYGWICIRMINYMIMFWDNFGWYTHLANDPEFESLSDDREFIEIIDQIKEEMRIIREHVFAMEAAEEL